MSAGKRTIRKVRYKIQTHDIVWYNGRKCETTGCHCNGTGAMLITGYNSSGKPEKQSVSVGLLKHAVYADGYYKIEQTKCGKEKAG